MTVPNSLHADISYLGTKAGDHLLPERVGIEIKNPLVLVSPEDALDDRPGVLVDNADPLDLCEIAQATVSNPKLSQT